MKQTQLELTNGIENVYTEALPMKAGENITVGMVIKKVNGAWEKGLGPIAYFANNSYTDFDAGGDPAFEYSLVHADGALITGVSGKADGLIGAPTDAFAAVPAVGTQLTESATAGKLGAATTGDRVIGVVDSIVDDIVYFTALAGEGVAA